MRELCAMIGTMMEMWMGGGEAETRPLTEADIARYYRWRPWLNRDRHDGPKAEAAGPGDATQDEIAGAWGDLYPTLLRETAGEC